MTVDVELTRPTDAQAVLWALAARGLEARVADDTEHVVVRADDLGAVEHALEDWTAEQGLPFVPMQVGDQSLVLAPPSA